jgi:hypothetical protein
MVNTTPNKAKRYNTRFAIGPSKAIRRDGISYARTVIGHENNSYEDDTSKKSMESTLYTASYGSSITEIDTKMDTFKNEIRFEFSAKFQTLQEENNKLREEMQKYQKTNEENTMATNKSLKMIEDMMYSQQENLKIQHQNFIQQQESNDLQLKTLNHMFTKFMEMNTISSPNNSSTTGSKTKRKLGVVQQSQKEDEKLPTTSNEAAYALNAMDVENINKVDNISIQLGDATNSRNE